MLNIYFCKTYESFEFTIELYGILKKINFISYNQRNKSIFIDVLHVVLLFLTTLIATGLLLMDVSFTIVYHV